jgi:hypothetical protein
MNSRSFICLPIRKNRHDIKQRKNFYIIKYLKVFFSSTMLIAFSLSGKIPNKYINGTTELFENPAYAPLMGVVALDSHLIENIRFSMVETEGRDKEGGRRYSEDKSPDHHWNLVKILFPSTGGTLNTDSGAQSHMGKFFTPKAIAILMHHTYGTREAIKKNPKRNSIAKNIVNKLIPSLGEAVPESRQWKNDFDSLIRSLAHHIHESIWDEKENKTIFPEYTTEQILSSFLIYHLNRQHQIEEYLSEFYELDKTHKVLKKFGDVKQDNPFSLVSLDTNGFHETVKRLKQDAHSLTLGDIFNLEVGDSLINPIPYQDGVLPISNGSTGFVEGRDGDIIEGDFQDCKETMVRHFLNILLFNPESRLFDIEQLLNKISEENPRRKNLKKFYEIQTVDQTDDGSRTVRTAWNQVVGDLNSLDPNHNIIYKQDGKNELTKGFINNIIRVFEVVFGQKFLKKNKDDIVTLEELKEAFKDLCRFINPNHDIVLDWSKVTYSHALDDFFGDLAVTLNKNVSFEIGDWEGHGKIQSIQVQGLKERKENFSEKHGEISLMVKKVGVIPLEQILTLSQETRGDMDRPLYSLTMNNINDNNGILKFFENYSHSSEDLKKNLNVERMVKKSIENFGWDDAQSVASLFSLFYANPHLKLYQHPLVLNKLDKVKSLNLARVTGIDSFLLPEGLINLSSITVPTSLKHLVLPSNFPNLRTLSMAHAVGLESIEILGETGINALEQFSYNLKSLVLKGPQPKLYSLVISNVQKLESLTLPEGMNDLGYFVPPPHLKKLTLEGKLPGLDDGLDVTFAKELESLFLLEQAGVRAIRLADHPITITGKKEDWSIVEKFDPENPQQQIVIKNTQLVTWVSL